MTREEISSFTQTVAKFVEGCMPQGVRFSVLVFDEATGRASLVSDMPDDSVKALTDMVVERGRDISLNEKKKGIL